MSSHWQLQILPPPRLAKETKSHWIILPPPTEQHWPRWGAGTGRYGTKSAEWTPSASQSVKFLTLFVQDCSFWILLKREIRLYAWQRVTKTDNTELKQRRFWATHVNWKRGLFHLKASWRYQICISKCLYYYRDYTTTWEISAIWLA